MSKTVEITSTAQFSTVISSSSIVVADFYADWCGPCKQIAPIYEQLSAQLTRPNKITFTRINTDKQQELAAAYGVRALPTFMIFKNARTIQTLTGAEPQKLSQAIKKLANEADALGGGKESSGGFSLGESSDSSAPSWLSLSSLPKGYKDVTDQIDIKGLELLNCDSSFGSVRTLFDATAPSKKEDKKDWIESDTDEQLMLYVPFQSTLKVHSLYITSHALASSDDDEEPMRPKTIKLFINKPHILGFEEAEDVPETQTMTLASRDWDPKSGTAKVELRFVKFQNVTSLVMFVVDGDGTREKIRIDRVRIVGETGEKRNPGKLEKVGDDD